MAFSNLSMENVRTSICVMESLVKFSTISAHESHTRFISLILRQNRTLSLMSIEHNSQFSGSLHPTAHPVVRQYISRVPAAPYNAFDVIYSYSDLLTPSVDSFIIYLPAMLVVFSRGYIKFYPQRVQNF